MNYYWWQDTDTHVGNVYAEDEKEAKTKVERDFNCKVKKVELLEKDVIFNRFKGLLFDK